MKLQKISSVFSSVALLAALAACGGGGGGSSGSDASTLPSGQSGSGSVVFGNYAAGSEEGKVFNLLNTERSNCGFGKFVQNGQLDVAAKAHADYQLMNSTISHEETENPRGKGFSGAKPLARVEAAGYLNAGAVTDEIAGFIGTNDKTEVGEKALRNLLNAPYHLQGLMSGFRDVGLSVRSADDTGVGKATVLLQVNAAYKRDAGPQLFTDAQEIHTYPCEGTQGVNSKLSNEEPNPIRGRDLSTNPLGSSIYIAARDGRILRITSAAMFQRSNGQSVVLRAPVTSENDPYQPCLSGCFKSHQAYVVADAPLQKNTEYQVTITGTNQASATASAIPFSRNFTFTTGSGGG